MDEFDPAAFLEEVEWQVRGCIALLERRPTPDPDLVARATELRQAVRAPTEALRDANEALSLPAGIVLEAGVARQHLRRKQGRTGNLYRSAHRADAEALEAELVVAQELASWWQREDARQAERAGQHLLARLPLGVGDELVPALSSALYRLRVDRDNAQARVRELRGALANARQQVDLADEALHLPARRSWLYPADRHDLEQRPGAVMPGPGWTGALRS